MHSNRNWLWFPLLLLTTLAAQAYPPMNYLNAPQGPLLGVRVADLPFQDLGRLDLEYGVRVVDVAPAGPAAKSGLAPHDVLLSVNGKPVYSSARLRWLIAGAAPGEPVALEVLRGNERRSLRVDLSPPRPTPALTPSEAPLSPPDGAFLGVNLQEMTDELREAFGATDGRGVLVARVQEDSPAAHAGIKAGDMIVRLDKKDVTRVDDVYRALAYFDPGAEVGVGIVRQGKPLQLNVTLGERQAGAGVAGDWRRWYDPDALRRMLPPPEYWRRMMDEMMRSLEDSWEDLRRDSEAEAGQYY